MRHEEVQQTVFSRSQFERFALASYAMAQGIQWTWQTFAEYLDAVDAASARVTCWSIGKTEEGRDTRACAVADEATIKTLDKYKQMTAQLTDPRKLTDAQAKSLIGTAKPIYWLTGSIHVSETGSPEMLMELAYRLAVDESPYIRNIRDHVITMITPIVEVDGRDRIVDLYEWKKAHPGQVVPNAIYWGHYVAHDNNRDAMGMTLKLTQNVLNTYVSWKAMALHDLHESVAYLYDNTIGDGPFNAWLRGLAQAGAQLFYGLAGAQARAQFVQAGIQLIELDPAEEQRWRAKVAVVERELRDELVRAGRDANALLSEVYQAAEATRGMTSNELMAQALEHPLTNILPMPEGR